MILGEESPTRRLDVTLMLAGSVETDQLAATCCKRCLSKLAGGNIIGKVRDYRVYKKYAETDTVCSAKFPVTIIVS